MSTRFRFGRLLLLLTGFRLLDKKIGDAGVKAIAQALRTNTTVQMLVLSGASVQSRLGERCDLDLPFICLNIFAVGLFSRCLESIRLGRE